MGAARVRTLRPATDPNESIWARTRPPRRVQPALQGEQRADVIVVGAGFTGLSAALHIHERWPERRIVVLEAGEVGHGASGRNGGMALHGINGVHHDDEGAAQQQWALCEAGFDVIEGMIRRHDLVVRFSRRGCLEAFTDAARADTAAKEAERLAAWGLPYRFLAGEALRNTLDARGVVGAILDPRAGTLHGLDLVHGVAEVLVHRGVALAEHSPVLRWRAGAEHRVECEEGAVTAPTLILAVNAWAGHWAGALSGVVPLHSHLFATEPMAPERWAAIGWGDVDGFTDDLDRIAYASRTAEGRLVFGGGGNAAYGYRWGSDTAWSGQRDAAIAFIRNVMLRYFPQLDDVRIEQQWSGPVALTLSRIFSVGAVPGIPRAFYAAGYSGHGVVLANLAGRVLADLIDGEVSPWRDAPFYERAIPWLPPEPFRWLGYHLYTSVTGRSPRRREG